MNSVFASGVLLILCFGLVIDVSVSQSQFGDIGIGSTRNEPSMVFKYDRIDEVKKQCRSYLPQAQNDKQPYSKRLFKLKDRMSFVNGDWWQDLDKAPLMPLKSLGLNGLNGSNALNKLNETETDAYVNSSPLNLVSFWVTNVDRAHRAKNSVNVNGILKVGITIGELSISFQGIVSDTDDSNGETIMCLLGNTMLPYRYPDKSNPWDWVNEPGDTDDSNGETVMCLLGNTMLPYRYPDKSNPWDWVNEPGYINQPPLIQDDQILLVIRYPKTFSLTQRGIYGSLKSLNPKTSQKYFDEVHVSSSLSGVVNYEFSADKLVSKACTPYPYKDEFVDTGVEMYKGADFCLVLERFTGQDFPLTVVPNWKCNGTNEYCSKLGPFDTDTSIKATNGSFKGVRLSLQDVRCEETSLTGKNKNNGGSKFTKVAAVIRVVPPSEDYYNVAQRSGLNNMTLAVEGIWEASSGQLCMIGSIIIGTIANVDEGKPANESYFPLAFEKQVRPYELYDQYTASHPSYKYSKINLAGTVLERHEPFSFGTVIKKSLLTFPKLNDADSYLVGLSLLSEDLTLHHPAVPDSGRTRSLLQADVQFEILSIGSLFGHYWSQQNDSITEEEIPKGSEKTYTEKQLLLNVSGQISLLGPGSEYGNFSGVFVEGLYYPVVGKMYLVGCRDIGDVLIPVTAILLAIVVHAQQKFGYEKLAGLLDFGKFRVLPRRSVAYERLSPVVEAEMTSGVDRDRKEVEIQAYVQKQCDKDDAARHEAIIGVITLFEQEMSAKEDLRKQYAECKDIRQKDVL
nr:nucleolar protein [Tanacetum cinerariifolium]